MARFEAEVTLQCTAQAIFDFLVDPENVVKISPPEIDLEFFHVPRPLDVGSQVEFRIRQYGIVQHCIHEITELQAPHRLTERQVQGPFKYFVHEHHIHPDGNDGTTMRDRIEFEPPRGLVGLWLNEAKIRKTLASGFAHRHRELKRHLEPTE